MNVTVNTQVLYSAVQKLAKIAPKKPVQPILKSIKLTIGGDKLTLSATDLDTWLQIDIPVIGFNGEPGALLVDAKELSKALAGSKKQTTQIYTEKGIGTDNTDVMIASMFTSRLTQPGEAIDYPSPPALCDKRMLTITRSQCDILANRVSYAAAGYDHASILGGVNLKTDCKVLNACATDGSRLIAYDTTVDVHMAGSVIVPVVALTTIDGVLHKHDRDVEVSVDGDNVAHHIRFYVKDSVKWGGDVTLISRTIGGEYPRYQELIPTTSSGSSTYRTAELLEVAKRVDKLDDRCHLMVISGGYIQTREGDFSANVEHDGDNAPDRIALNAHYLAQWLATAGDTVKILFTGDKNRDVKPVLIKDEELTYLVMPVQMETPGKPHGVKVKTVEPKGAPKPVAKSKPATVKREMQLAKSIENVVQ